MCPYFNCYIVMFVTENLKQKPILGYMRNLDQLMLNVGFIMVSSIHSPISRNMIYGLHQSLEGQGTIP